MVHGLPWHDILPLLPADQPGGVPHGGAPGRHVDEHHGPSSDLGAGADPDVAEDGRAGADEHAVADLGVPVAHRLARAAQRDVVEDGDVVAHDGRLPDDDARGVVEQDAPADGGGRVDVDGEDLGDAGLERERQRAAALRPQHVRDAVRLHGEEALVVEEAVREARARRVPRPRRDEVGGGGGADGRVRRERGHEEVVEQRGEQRGGAELVGEVEGEGAVQGRVRQHRGVEERRQRRLRVRVAPRLGLDLGPDPGLVAVRLGGRVRRHDVRLERRRRRGRGRGAVVHPRGLGCWLGAQRLAGRHPRVAVGACVCGRWGVPCAGMGSPVPVRAVWLARSADLGGGGGGAAIYSPRAGVVQAEPRGPAHPESTGPSCREQAERARSRMSNDHEFHEAGINLCCLVGHRQLLRVAPRSRNLQSGGPG